MAVETLKFVSEWHRFLIYEMMPTYQLLVSLTCSLTVYEKKSIYNFDQNPNLYAKIDA